MELRPELTPPVVPPDRITALCTAIEAVTELLESGARDAAEEAIAAFNTDTGHDYDAHVFLTYWTARDVEDFALEAARPAAPKVPDITHAELTEIVHRLQSGERDCDYYLLLLEANVADPNVSDLIHHPPPSLADAPPEAIVDAALAYRPIAL